MGCGALVDLLATVLPAPRGTFSRRPRPSPALLVHSSHQDDGCSSAAPPAMVSLAPCLRSLATGTSTTVAAGRRISTHARVPRV
jgi:hypothetical protein